MFGLLGLFIADMIVNWATVQRPVLRSTAIVISLAFLVYTLLVGQQVRDAR